jgi:hypothetical protein
LRSKRLHIEKLNDRSSEQEHSYHGVLPAKAQDNHQCHLSIADQPKKSAAASVDTEHPRNVMRDWQFEQQPMVKKNSMGNRERCCR